MNALPRTKIDRLTISGFKSIKHLQGFELKDLNVLIGSNGSGKSNFISYFSMLRAVVEGRLKHWSRKHGSADRILTFGAKETKWLDSVIVSSQFAYTFNLESSVNGDLVFSRECFDFVANSCKRHPPLMQCFATNWKA